MKSLPAEKFTEVDEILYNNLAFLVPRVGDDFLPMSPSELMRKGEFKDTELLLGVTRDEGSMLAAFQLGDENGDWYGETIDANSFQEHTAKEILQPFIKNNHYDKIVHKYFQRVKEQSRYTYLDAVSDILGDSIITCPTVFHADFQSLKKRQVYFYVFDYRSPSSPYPRWMGVPHFEETPYVFGNPLLKAFSDKEEELSRYMMDRWVAFARTG